jgi:antitoxin ParD1/3/4
MNEDIDDGWPAAEEKAKNIAQAKALKEKVQNGGLRFEAYLPPGLAEWLLGLIERGVFVDPSEAVFVILGEHKDLEPHADLRRELLRRTLQTSMDDPRPSIPHEEVMEQLRKMTEGPRAEPAEWRRAL